MSKETNEAIMNKARGELEAQGFFEKTDQLIPVRCSQCTTGKVEVPRAQLYDTAGNLIVTVCPYHEANTIQ